MTPDAARNRDRDAVYHATHMDSHTSAELPLDQIRRLSDDLIKAHEMESYFKRGKAFAIPKMCGRGIKIWQIDPIF